MCAFKSPLLQILILLYKLVVSLKKITLQICSYVKTVVIFMLSENDSKEKIKLRFTVYSICNIKLTSVLEPKWNHVTLNE